MDKGGDTKIIEVLAQIPTGLTDALSFFLYASGAAIVVLPLVVVGRLAYAFLRD